MRRSLEHLAHRALRNVRLKDVPALEDMTTWTERLGSSKLRTFTGEYGHFWLERNPDNRSKWAKLARGRPQDRLGVRTPE